MPRDGRGHGARGRYETEPARGIPDSLLVGLLAFLLGLTLLVWSATGLAALFARGSWPATVSFTRTPMAMRSLATRPHDLAAAWPDTAPGQLSGWGLFWGVFISELMVLFVLTVFTIGVLARTKARRADRREAAAAAAAQEPYAPEPAPVDEPAVRAPGPRRAPAGQEAGTGPRPEPVAFEKPAPAPRTEPTDEAYRYGFGYTPAPAAPVSPVTAEPWSGGPEARLFYGAPADRQRAAARRIAEAEGAALVVTSSPALWADTKDARAKLGPVLLYDPSHLCDTPARLHWHPGTGCTDRETAAARAAALLSPVRPQARIDAAVADTAETLLRSWLHAAALEDRPFKQLHRWALGSGTQEPVRILRTHPKAAPGMAGELENALTAHPERREIARELTARALACLSSIHIRDACTPNRTDALTLASFLDEGGTLYLVGEPVEDPRTAPGAMPLLTALASSVVEHGRRMAARSSDGRLDPPLTLVLDDLAAVAPLPQLPELLADTGPAALPLLALLRSREQARSRWPALTAETVG